MPYGKWHEKIIILGILHRKNKVVKKTQTYLWIKLMIIESLTGFGKRISFSLSYIAIKSVLSETL